MKVEECAELRELASPVAESRVAAEGKQVRLVEAAHSPFDDLD